MLADLVSSHPFVVGIAVALLGLWLIVRPRRGGPNAPPMVLYSTEVAVPYLGMAIEFGKSPILMVRRCFEAYGPVFTVPVSTNSTCDVADVCHWLAVVLP